MPGFYETEFGSRWEGLPSWPRVTKAMDLMLECLPAATVGVVKSMSGNTEFPPSDVVCTTESLAFMSIGDFNLARPIWIGPDQLLALPEWDDAEEALSSQALRFGLQARPPFQVTYLDFCDQQGKPTVLPHTFRGQQEEELKVAMYGAMVIKVPEEDRRVESDFMMATGSLIIVPFGAMVLIDGQERVPVHGRTRNGKVFQTPGAAPLGYVEFGEVPEDLRGNHEPFCLLGETGVKDAPKSRRPMLSLLHVVPDARMGDRGATIVVGTGSMTEYTVSLNPNPSMGIWEIQDEQFESMVTSQALVVAYQADQALKALYLLEAANVDFAPVKVSRQVRRAVERSNGTRKIALTITVRSRKPRRQTNMTRGSGHGRTYSHSFDRSGHYAHVTRGSHVKDPSKVASCPDWEKKHPHSEVCRREWHPPAVIDAGEGKPYVPKIRKLGDLE